METFNFKTDYIFENERVLLRPLKTDDADHLMDYAIHEPDIWHFNANGAGGAKHLKTYIANAIQQREKELEYAFIVFDKRTDSFAGSTRFYDIRLDRSTIQLGFTWYGKRYHGTGLNKNCKYLLLEFAFDQLGMERVGFAANLKNERSISAMKGIGCQVEGVLRSNGFNAAGDRIDSILLSILKKEWHDEWKDKLKRKADHTL